MSRHSYRVDPGEPDELGRFRVYVPGGMLRMSLAAIRAHIDLGHDVQQFQPEEPRA